MLNLLSPELLIITTFISEVLLIILMNKCIRKNINKRIKLLYGKNYGLSFQSNYGHGTKVKIKIPKITEKDKSI